MAQQDVLYFSILLFQEKRKKQNFKTVVQNFDQFPRSNIRGIVPSPRYIFRFRIIPINPIKKIKKKAIASILNS